MTVKPLTEHHLEFLSLTGGCTGSSESTLVKMPHCRKSHVTAHNLLFSYTSCLLVLEYTLRRGDCSDVNKLLLAFAQDY